MQANTSSISQQLLQLAEVPFTLSSLELVWTTATVYQSLRCSCLIRLERGFVGLVPAARAVWQNKNACCLTQHQAEHCQKRSPGVLHISAWGHVPCGYLGIQGWRACSRALPQSSLLCCQPISGKACVSAHSSCVVWRTAEIRVGLGVRTLTVCIEFSRRIRPQVDAGSSRALAGQVLAVVSQVNNQLAQRVCGL